jgi:hypothetical protein
MIIKTCKDCGQRKIETAFYWYKKSQSRFSSCKECTKERVRNHRAENIEAIRAYDRERGLLPERKARVKANAHKYKRLPSTWREKHKEKYKAHIAVNNALRTGQLVRPKNCERCGGTYALHGHHEDYNKPLEVNWLCRFCHGERHREINEERRQMMCEAAE